MLIKLTNHRKDKFLLDVKYIREVSPDNNASTPTKSTIITNMPNDKQDGYLSYRVYETVTAVHKLYKEAFDFMRSAVKEG